MRPTFLPSPRSSSSSQLWETAGRQQQRRRRRRLGRPSPYDDDEGFLRDEDYEYFDDDNDDDEEDGIVLERTSRSSSRRKQERDYYDDDDDDIIEDPDARKRASEHSQYYEEEDYEDEDNYDEDDNEYENSRRRNASRPRPVEWEEVQVPNLRTANSRRYEDELDDDVGTSTAYILLPPAPPTMHPKPLAVLHFVGGTVFGSAPKAFYRSLLEDIVTHTQCAIVVTPLPVITPLNARGNGGMGSAGAGGPLQHVQMAKNLKHQFQYAFEQVLEDEYGKDEMKSVPIAGMGHSLGSRLLVVLATLMENSNNNNTNTDDEAMLTDESSDENDSESEPTRRSRRRRRGSRDGDNSKAPSRDFAYKSMILVSFTNFGADAGIPGVTSLLKQRRRIDQKNSEKQQRGSSYNEEPRRRPRRSSRSRRKGRGDWYDDDDDEDLLEEWSDLWSEFQGVFQDQADRVKTQLTPQAEDLEFYPTPRQLWAAVEGDADNGQPGRYQIPQTLLVQFDRDDMDQSAKLATAIVASGNKLAKVKISSNSATVDASTNRTHSDEEGDCTVPQPVTDLKFARLRGTHLTPVTTSASKQFDDSMINGYSSSRNGGNKGLLREWSSKSTKAVWNAIQGRVIGGKAEGGNMSQEEALRDLRQTITRYIADVVTK